MEDLFNSFKQKKVLIVGDVMIDRYEKGSVSRISPEAPVPVLAWSKTENRLGGAANVALNIKALGAKPLLLGVVGDDKDGNIFKNLLKEEHIENDLIFSIENRISTVKTRMMAGGQQLLRLDKETLEEINSTIEEQIIAKITNLLEKKAVDVIILQDYNKGLLTENLIHQIIEKATHFNIKTCVDPKKQNFAAYKNVTLFKPNLKEMSAFLGKKINSTLEELDDAATLFRKNSPCKNLMITLSEKGIFIDNDEKSEISPTFPRNIADVCGAGDTVIAVAALALSCEIEMNKIAMLCNIAGGQVCEEIGVVPIRKDKFLSEVNKNLR